MKLSSNFSWLYWFEEGGLVGVTQKEQVGDRESKELGLKSVGTNFEEDQPVG